MMTAPIPAPKPVISSYEVETAAILPEAVANIGALIRGRSVFTARRALEMLWPTLTPHIL